jgi:hypothetical protein
MQEHHRLAVGITAKLPIKAVTIADVEHAGLIGLDFGVEPTTGAGVDVHQKLNSS